jgi:hypothetical protein
MIKEKKIKMVQENRGENRVHHNPPQQRNKMWIYFEILNLFQH